MRKGCTISVLVGLLALYGCYRSDFADPPGWSCKSLGQENCAPQNGQWEGLKVGMSRADALKTACSMMKRGAITSRKQWERQWNGFALYIHNPVEIQNGICRPQERSTGDETWVVQARHLRCIWFLERQVVYVQFDKKDRLKRLMLSCPVPII